MKVKFYYSSKDKPGEQYPNNNAACVEKIKALESRGVDAEAVFGRATPAVLVWGDPKDRYPTDAYPRQDQARGGLVGCEKALDDLTKELAKMPTTEDEEDQPLAR